MKLTKHVQTFMQQHPQVKEWLRDRPIGTQIKYGSALKHFCDSVGVSPTEFACVHSLKRNHFPSFNFL